MRLCRLLLIAGVLLASPIAASAETGSDQKPLPPEKTHIIYNTLLAPEQDAATPSGAKEEPSAQPPTADASAAGMTPEKVADILGKRGITLQGEVGRWQFLYEGMQIFLLIDSEHNRIRLVTPLTRLDLLRSDPDFNEVELLQKLLKADYLATGDVRFCLNNHVVWVAFLHPLDSLTERDLLSALGQMVEVARRSREAGG